LSGTSIANAWETIAKAVFNKALWE
jgi:hypothetical protein